MKKDKIEKRIGEYSIIFEITCLSQLLSALKFTLDLENLSNQDYIEVGYWVSDKKFDAMRKLHSALNSKFPVKYVPIDLRFQLKRKVQTFLHKITDAAKNLKDPYSLMIIENFNQIAKINKDILLFDHHEILNLVTSRIIFEKKLSNILSNEKFFEDLNSYFENHSEIKRFKIRLPISMTINPKDIPTLEAQNQRSLSGLHYPLIFKTKAACHSEASHFMAVAYDDEGFSAVENHPIFRYFIYILCFIFSGMKSILSKK